MYNEVINNNNNKPMCDLNCSTCEIKTYLIKEKNFTKEQLEGKTTFELMNLIEDAGAMGSLVGHLETHVTN